jgi:hypothetical protein
MLAQVVAPERHILVFPYRTSRPLLHFQLLSYAPKFHETESGSGTKNAAHHDNYLYVHWRGLLSRRDLATALDLYTNRKNRVPKRYSKALRSTVSILVS